MRFKIIDRVEREPVKRGELRMQRRLDGIMIDNSKAIRLTYQHNPYWMPFGKIEKTAIDAEKSEVVQTCYIPEDSETRFIHENSRVECVREHYHACPKPWITGDSGPDASLSVDLSHLQSNAMNGMTEELARYGLTLKFHDRREALPIPLLEILSGLTVSEALRIAMVAFLLGAGATAGPAVGKRIPDWIEASAKWLKREAIPAMVLWQKNRSTQSKCEHPRFLYEFIFDGEGAKEYDARIRVILDVASGSQSLPLNILDSLPEQLATWSDILAKSDEMVFAIRPDSDELEFRYALLKDGGTVSSSACYTDTDDFRTLSLLALKAGTRTWGRLERLEDGTLEMVIYIFGVGPAQEVARLAVPNESTALKLGDNFVPLFFEKSDEPSTGG